MGVWRKKEAEVIAQQALLVTLARSMVTSKSSCVNPGPKFQAANQRRC